MDEDPEALADSGPRPLPSAAPTKRPPARARAKTDKITAANWPFRAAAVPKRTVDLGRGAKMDLVLLPAGEFVMGDLAGEPDEQPRSRVRIDKPFWIGVCEVTNRQYARFDPSHDSRVESKNGYQFGVHGYPVNLPDQPVVRISWRQATAFCRWLSRKTARHFSLPTEAQWEYACRAGTATAFSFGPPAADFSKHANVADKKLRDLASDGYAVFKPLGNPTRYDDWVPRDNRFNDGGLITTPVGSYRPNPWGLRDMHGNVFEWTRTTYHRYPYRPDDTANTSARKVVRGGSWRDRPTRCRSAFRLAYRPYQIVYNVGFRVICDPRTFHPG
jgi:formylglycine-generating enzyme required for sulfatase activity